MGVLARQAQAAVDRGVVVRVADHETQHVFGVDRRILSRVGLFQAIQGNDGIPALVDRFQRLRHQRHLPRHIEQARQILGPLHVAGHPEKMVGSTG